MLFQEDIFALIRLVRISLAGLNVYKASGIYIGMSSPDVMEGRKLSRFEVTRIISARALQIAQGSPTFVEPPRGVIDPLEIAKLEWEKGLIPIEARKRVNY